MKSQNFIKTLHISFLISIVITLNYLYVTKWLDDISSIGIVDYFLGFRFFDNLKLYEFPIAQLVLNLLFFIIASIFFFAYRNSLYKIVRKYFSTLIYIKPTFHIYFLSLLFSLPLSTFFYNENFYQKIFIFSGDFILLIYLLFGINLFIAFVSDKINVVIKYKLYRIYYYKNIKLNEFLIYFYRLITKRIFIVSKFKIKKNPKEPINKFWISKL